MVQIAVANDGTSKRW